MEGLPGPVSWGEFLRADRGRQAGRQGERSARGSTLAADVWRQLPAPWWPVTPGLHPACEGPAKSLCPEATEGSWQPGSDPSIQASEPPHFLPSQERED